MLEIKAEDEIKIVKFFNFLGKYNLVQALESTDPEVKEVAIWALVKTQNYAEITAFTGALADKNTKVSQIARWAVEQVIRNLQLKLRK